MKTVIRQPNNDNTMALADSQRIQRRQFLQTLSGLAVGAFGAMLAPAEDLPRNTSPRAIFGDSIEPDWKQRLVITVGHENADLIGTTDRVVQAAVDYVARRGGGTVRVLAGVARVAFDVDGLVRNSLSCKEGPHFLAITCPTDENARRRAVLVKIQGMRRTVDRITAQNHHRFSPRVWTLHTQDRLRAAEGSETQGGGTNDEHHPELQPPANGPLAKLEEFWNHEGGTLRSLAH
jgi:hypothetical protein